MYSHHFLKSYEYNYTLETIPCNIPFCFFFMFYLSAWHEKFPEAVFYFIKSDLQPNSQNRRETRLADGIEAAKIGAQRKLEKEKINFGFSGTDESFHERQQLEQIKVPPKLKSLAYF